MDGHLSRDLREKIENPLVFQLPAAAAASPPLAQAHGYDAAILIDICNAILAAKADGKLTGARYARMIEQAQIITSASAKQGIRDLVYAVAGYSQTAEEVIAAFKLYVTGEAREYEKEFPDRLYAEWYRLYELPKPSKNKPWKFKHLTVDQVYKPLARSNGKVLDLTRLLRSQSGERYKKLHQFLSEIGVKALRIHLGQLLGIAQVSRNRTEYEERVDSVFGDEPRLPL